MYGLDVTHSVLRTWLIVSRSFGIARGPRKIVIRELGSIHCGGASWFPCWQSTDLVLTIRDQRLRVSI